MSETILCNFPETLTSKPPSIFDLGLVVAGTVRHGNQMRNHGLCHYLLFGGLRCLLYTIIYAPCLSYPIKGYKGWSPFFIRPQVLSTKTWAILCLVMHSEKDTEGGQSPTDVGTCPSSIDIPPDGGLEAWLVVAGAWCSSFCSWGWINSQFLSPRDKTKTDIVRRGGLPRIL